MVKMALVIVLFSKFPKGILVGKSKKGLSLKKQREKSHLAQESLF